MKRKSICRGFLTLAAIAAFGTQASLGKAVEDKPLDVCYLPDMAPGKGKPQQAAMGEELIAYICPGKVVVNPR